MYYSHAIINRVNPSYMYVPLFILPKHNSSTPQYLVRDTSRRTSLSYPALLLGSLNSTSLLLTSLTLRLRLTLLLLALGSS